MDLKVNKALQIGGLKWQKSKIKTVLLRFMAKTFVLQRGKGIDSRIVIEVLIILHIEAKDDRGTIEMLADNL